MEHCARTLLDVAVSGQIQIHTFDKIWYQVIQDNELIDSELTIIFVQNRFNRL